MTKKTDKPANPHAWTDADYEAKGLGKVTLRLPTSVLARLEAVAKRLRLSRATVVQMGIERIDRENKKDA